uniref:Claudin h n=1 Tax=Oryzias latipes TaxID=8090 RepID=A0A3P9MEY6_ORYLA
MRRADICELKADLEICMRGCSVCLSSRIHCLSLASFIICECWSNILTQHRAGKSLRSSERVFRVRVFGLLFAATQRGIMSMGLELAGICLGFIGFIGAIIICVLPQWRTSAFIGSNIVTAQVIWEGLWMNCVTQSTGQMQCKMYDSMLALSPDLQAFRAMTVVAIILGVLGVLISIIGAKCTNCIEDETGKAKVMIISGIFFILAGLLVLIPVSWSANTIIQDFYNPLVVEAQKREVGASLYIGWGAAALLLIGGALLCTRCPPKEEKYKPIRMAYSAPDSITTGEGLSWCLCQTPPPYSSALSGRDQLTLLISSTTAS